MTSINYPNDFAPENFQVEQIDSSSIWIQNDVICIFAHPSQIHTIEQAKLGNDILDKLIPDKRLPMICDVRNSQALTKEVRQYYGSEEGQRHCTKFAFIVSSAFSKVVANFFIGFSNIPHPIKMFTNTKDAFEWSRKDLNIK